MSPTAETPFMSECGTHILLKQQTVLSLSRASIEAFKIPRPQKKSNVRCVISTCICMASYLCNMTPYFLDNLAHTQSVSSEGLRQGLRVLGGSDPLSEVEHQALFRDISRGHDRVQYRVRETRITRERIPSGPLRRERGRIH